MDEPTLFTKIIRGEIPSSKVAEGDLWYAFLDIYPRRAGHTLVVPKEQAQRISDLSSESRQALMEGVVEVQRRLTAEFGTRDFSVGIHDGPTAGQEVPHVHIHVCPRTFGDGGLTLLACWPDSPSPGGDPDFASLSTLSERLQSH
ncbi:MAG: HIT family protein [Candidatus Poseidoniales archaeon]|nr:HIT family protein [Candidatus Poseidoniales archaeon]|tara:strand:- start:282 stop:716 length:435 start_codon:yes stop_codon:yes gene_type:complete